MATQMVGICRDCARTEIRLVGRGLCGRCYDIHWNAKTLDLFPKWSRPPAPPRTHKPCAICQIDQPLENFARNNRRPDGRGSYCKPCAKTKYHRPAVTRKLRVERPVDGQQECRKCGETKPFSEYYWEADKGRYRYRCRACHLDQSRVRWSRTGGKNQRLANLKNKYNLTEADYADLLDLQGGGCAICGGTEPGRALAVDHCHTNGHVRGLLCGNCNRGIGMLRDDVELLRAATQYLINDINRQ